MRAPRLILFVTASLCSWGASARAQDVEIGTRLVCNTQQQVERFVALFDGDPQRTANSVNATSLRDPKACAFYSMSLRPAVNNLTTAKKRDTDFSDCPACRPRTGYRGRHRHGSTDAAFLRLSK